MNNIDKTAIKLASDLISMRPQADIFSEITEYFEINNLVEASASVSYLKEKLIEFISASSYQEELLGSAFWSLGKVVTDRDRALLVSELKNYESMNPETLYQLLCALDNLGERILGPSSSVFEYEDNKQKARICIQKNGL